MKRLVKVLGPVAWSARVRRPVHLLGAAPDRRPNPAHGDRRPVPDQTGGGAQVSPDGEWVAYTVSTTNLEKDQIQDPDLDGLHRGWRPHPPDHVRRVGLGPQVEPRREVPLLHRQPG